MKKIFSILFLFTLTNCGDNINDKSKRNEKFCWFLDEKTGKGKWFPIGDGEWTETGKVTYFFFNGNVAETAIMKDGERCDTAYSYNLQGKLIRLVFYNNDTPVPYYPNDGIYKDYFLAGTVASSGMVKNHQRIRTWTAFRKNGSIAATETFHDSIYSTKINYYDSGKMRDSTSYKNHIQNGTRKDWKENGILESVSKWKDGLQNGEAILFYENGKPHQKILWVNGEQKEKVKWNKNGELLK